MNKTLAPWHKTAPPFPAIGQSVKWQHLERNLFIAAMVLILALTAFAIYKVETREQERARIQQEQERRAIQQKHAANVTPDRTVQTIPGWVFEVRKQQP